MSAIVDDILSNIDIVDVIGKYVQLKKAGSNFSGLCPFHGEKTPSFIVSPQKQIFKCFWCWVGGNVINFVKEIERVDFRDVVKILARDYSLDISKYEKNYEKYSELTEWKEKIKRLHKLAQAFFTEQLLASKSALDYLHKDRKLEDDVIKNFSIGYAPSSHYDLISYIKKKKFLDTDITEASLSKKWQSWDTYTFFRNRIMFPIFDTMWNVVAFSWRVIDPKDSPKYLNSSEHPAFEKSKILYGLHVAKNYIKDHKKIIVLEWQMDVIACHRLWVPVGVATCGTALTKDHIKTIKRYTEDVYLLFDQDKAWRQATIRWLKIAYQQNIFPKVITLPPAQKDLDDLANTTTWKEIFDKALFDAKDWFLVVYDLLNKDIDKYSPVEKQKILNAMFELIVSLISPSLQIHYLNILADKQGLSYEVMSAQYRQYAKGDWQFMIKQLEKQQTAKKMYQIPREIIVASLFKDNFIKLLVPEEETICQNITDVIKIVHKILPEDKIGIVSAWLEISSEVEEQLKEWQLRREKEIQSVIAEDQKIIHIKNIIAPILKKLIQIISKKITSEQRQKLLKIRKEIKW